MAGCDCDDCLNHFSLYMGKNSTELRGFAHYIHDEPSGLIHRITFKLDRMWYMGIAFIPKGDGTMVKSAIDYTYPGTSEVGIIQIINSWHTQKDKTQPIMIKSEDKNIFARILVQEMENNVKLEVELTDAARSLDMDAEEKKKEVAEIDKIQSQFRASLRK